MPYDPGRIIPRFVLTNLCTLFWSVLIVLPSFGGSIFYAAHHYFANLLKLHVMPCQFLATLTFSETSLLHLLPLGLSDSNYNLQLAMLPWQTNKMQSSLKATQQTVLAVLAQKKRWQLQRKESRHVQCRARTIVRCCVALTTSEYNGRGDLCFAIAESLGCIRSSPAGRPQFIFTRGRRKVQTKCSQV